METKKLDEKQSNNLFAKTSKEIDPRALAIKKRINYRRKKTQLQMTK